MQRHEPPYVRAKARAKAKAQEKHPYRYIGLLIAGLVLAFVITVNARAEGDVPRPASSAIWTDYNTHDPGQKVHVKADPLKVREMQVELAEEKEAEKEQTPPRDQWLLQSFGIGPQTGKR